MSIENFKSFDPFAEDEGDPFAETADVAPTVEPAGEKDKKTADVALPDPAHAKAPEADDLVSFPYEDPLAETADVGSTLDHLHIRIQQRNGRKTWTILQGLPKEYNEKRLLKAFKKEFACNGTVIDDKAGKIIQLQGDQRSKMMTFLVDKGVKKDTIMVHGF